MPSPSTTQSKSRKAKKGTVQVKNSNDRLQLVFSWQRQRYYFSTGLPDSPINRKLAEQKARQIELDFVSGNFDPSLDKYRPEVEQSQSQRKTPATPKLLDLWLQYMEYRTPNISPTTLNSTYEPVAAHIRKCKTDGLKNPLKFRTELLKATTESQARRSLMQISAACDWGLKHNLIQENPFSGMYLDMLQSKAPPPVAFTVEERDRIIAAFANDSRPGTDYRHYAPFVKFLFWTGCRPCEAIGLRWGSVLPDCSRVHFHESIVEISGRKVRRKEDKTAVKRWFTCPDNLKELLQSIRPEHPDPEALVFPSPKGHSMTASNFRDRGWTAILSELGLSMKEGIKMTPYNCRDTFITLQALQGHSSTTIARWVGNSSKIIEERYLDRMRLDHLRPTNI